MKTVELVDTSKSVLYSPPKIGWVTSTSSGYFPRDWVRAYVYFIDSRLPTDCFSVLAKINYNPIEKKH